MWLVDAFFIVYQLKLCICLYFNELCITCNILALIKACTSNCIGKMRALSFQLHFLTISLHFAVLLVLSQSYVCFSSTPSTLLILWSCTRTTRQHFISFWDCHYTKQLWKSIGIFINVPARCNHKDIIFLWIFSEENYSCVINSFSLQILYPQHKCKFTNTIF